MKEQANSISPQSTIGSSVVNLRFAAVGEVNLSFRFASFRVSVDATYVTSHVNATLNHL